MSKMYGRVDLDKYREGMEKNGIIDEGLVEPRVGIDLATGPDKCVMGDKYVEQQLKWWGKDDPYVRGFIIPHMSDEQKKKFLK